MADFTPTLMEKDGVGRRVSTWRDYYDALWEGFHAVGAAPEPLVFSERERAELSATYAARQVALAPQRVVPPPRASWVTRFEAGHGFVQGGAATVADDTTDAALGNQSVSLTIGTASGQGDVSKIGLPTINATGRAFVVWIKTADLSKIAGVHLLAGSGNFSAFFTLRTWLSGAAQKPTTNNRWTPIYFTFTQDAIAPSGAPDRTAITALKLRFFAASTVSAGSPLVVKIGGIGTVADTTAPFPNGAVSFTFDDGYLDQYTAARAYMDKYGFPGTLYMIAEQADQPNRLTLDQLKKMRDISGWEIAGHAFTEAAHTGRLDSLTPAQRDVELANLKAWMLDNGFNSDNFAYPGGVFNDAVVADVGRYFSTARTTSTQPTHSLLPPVDPLFITQYDPGSGGASALTNAKARLDNAKADKTWVQMMIHHVGAGGMSVADFQALMDHAQSIGIAVVTVQEAIRAAAPR